MRRLWLWETYWPGIEWDSDSGVAVNNSLGIRWWFYKKIHLHGKWQRNKFVGPKELKSLWLDVWFSVLFLYLMIVIIIASSNYHRQMTVSITIGLHPEVNLEDLYAWKLPALGSDIPTTLRRLMWTDGRACSCREWKISKQLYLGGEWRWR